MNFERHDNTIKGIGIGAEVAAILIVGVAYNDIINTGSKKFRAYRMMTESHAIRTLLRIENKDLENKYYGVRRNHTGQDSKWIDLNFYKEKWLRFRDHIYYIPK